MPNDIALFFLKNSILLNGLDWLLKSIIVLGLTLILSHGIKREVFSSASRHLMWLYSILCLLAIPFAPFAFEFTTMSAAPTGTMYTFIAIANSAVEPILVSPSEYPLANLLLIAYLLPAGFFLLRIMIGVAAVLRISNRAIPITELQTKTFAHNLAIKFQLKRPVHLALSKDVTSPFSCGILFPRIILPEHFTTWSQSTLEDVLTHELAHIKRLDWPTMLLCYVVTCLYWVNPLCWLALRRVNDEAELSCDSAALAHGRSANHYAESLVCIARQNRDSHRLLAQEMADKRLLPQRINLILWGSLIPASASAKFSFHLTAILAILTGIFSNLNLVSAQSIDISGIFRNIVRVKSVNQDMILINDDGDYPPIGSGALQQLARAQQYGVSGWNLVSFSLNEDGSVDGETIEIVEAEPQDIFDRSTIESASQFKFLPPAQIGEKFSKDEIRYVFQYVLDFKKNAQSLGAEPINREYLPLNYITPQYPSAAREGSIEGQVLVEFTITKQGIPSGIVILDRSPSDIFNAAAVNAAERLRFDPRIVNGDVAEVVGARHLFSFKL